MATATSASASPLPVCGVSNSGVQTVDYRRRSDGRLVRRYAYGTETVIDVIAIATAGGGITTTKNKDSPAIPESPCCMKSWRRVEPYEAARSIFVRAVAVMRGAVAIHCVAASCPVIYSGWPVLFFVADVVHADNRARSILNRLVACYIGCTQDWHFAVIWLARFDRR
jgi:hypothetical protein